MRENCTSGTARGGSGNRHSYRRGHTRESDLSLCLARSTRSEKEMTMRCKTVWLVMLLALVMMRVVLG
jgi:hypothetical protein